MWCAYMVQETFFRIMVLKLSLDIMKIYVEIAYFFHLQPYYWDEKSQLISVTTNIYKIKQWKLCSYTFVTLSTAAVIKFIISVVSGKEPITSVLLNTPLVSLQFGGIFAVLTCHSRTYEACQLLGFTKRFGMKQKTGFRLHITFY